MDMILEPQSLEKEVLMVPRSVLMTQANPFRAFVWPYMETAITKEMIAEAIEKRNVIPPHPSYSGNNCRNDENFDRLGYEKYVDWHVGRIAYLVENPSPNPIDVSIWGRVWKVDDGNHRVAAALYRGDKKIQATVGGDYTLTRRHGWRTEENIRQKYALSYLLCDQIMEVAVIKDIDNHPVDIIPIYDGKYMHHSDFSDIDVFDLKELTNYMQAMFGKVSIENISVADMEYISGMPDNLDKAAAYEPDLIRLASLLEDYRDEKIEVNKAVLPHIGMPFTP